MTTPKEVVKHSGLNKMAAILQTTFSNAFSCMKYFVFWFKFHWSMFNWQEVIIGLGNGLSPNLRQAITLTKGDLVLQCQIASLGLNELKNTDFLVMEITITTSWCTGIYHNRHSGHCYAVYTDITYILGMYSIVYKQSKYVITFRYVNARKM